MHYEKAPLLQRVAVVMGAASAPLHCRSATAALGSNGNGEWGAKGLQKDIGKSAREWHFDLDHPIAFGADRHRNHSLPKTRNGTAGATLDSSVGFLPTPGFPKRLGFGRQWGGWCNRDVPTPTGRSLSTPTHFDTYFTNRVSGAL
jgi:hypothetical protein